MQVMNQQGVIPSPSLYERNSSRPNKVALAVSICLVTLGVLWASVDASAQAAELSQ